MWKTPAWYQLGRSENQRPFYSSSNAWRGSCPLLLGKPQTNKQNKPCSFLRWQNCAWLNFEGHSLAWEPFLQAFSLFYLAALVWNISSTLKTGQVQGERSEQSHDLNCEFYRSQQTPEITPGNYCEHGLSLATVLLVKNRYPPRLVWPQPKPQHSPSSSGVRCSDLAEADGMWSLCYEQDPNRTWKSPLNTTCLLDVHLQAYDGQHSIISLHY